MGLKVFFSDRLLRTTGGLNIPALNVPPLKILGLTLSWLWMSPLQPTLAQLSGDAGRINYEALETAIVAETNRLRQDPQRYSQRLSLSRSYYQGLIYGVPGEMPVRTLEGVSAVNEAIVYLNSQYPMDSLRRSWGMDLAARDQVVDQGQTGAIGHEGSDGSKPSDRLNRYGTWRDMAAENISYGAETGAEVIRQLLVDDGVASRSHRLMLLNPIFKKMGVACGPHPRYQVLCVMTYAKEYQETPAVGMRNTDWLNHAGFY